MNTQKQLPVDFRAAAIEALIQLRQEWSETADGENLVDIDASVGLLLFDVTALLGFSNTEREAVLGIELARHAEVLLSTTVHNIA